MRSSVSAMLTGKCAGCIVWKLPESLREFDDDAPTAVSGHCLEGRAHDAAFGLGPVVRYGLACFTAHCPP